MAVLRALEKARIDRLPVGPDLRDANIPRWLQPIRTAFPIEAALERQLRSRVVGRYAAEVARSVRPAEGRRQELDRGALRLHRIGIDGLQHDLRIPSDPPIQSRRLTVGRPIEGRLIDVGNVRVRGRTTAIRTTFGLLGIDPVAQRSIARIRFAAETQRAAVLERVSMIRG